MSDAFSEGIPAHRAEGNLSPDKVATRSANAAATVPADAE